MVGWVNTGVIIRRARLWTSAMHDIPRGEHTPGRKSTGVRHYRGSGDQHRGHALVRYGSQRGRTEPTTATMTDYGSSNPRRDWCNALNVLPIH